VLVEGKFPSLSDDELTKLRRAASFVFQFFNLIRSDRDG
jgi:ABC-type lipoprotein export system ATPase subunit